MKISLLKDRLKIVNINIIKVIAINVLIIDKITNNHTMILDNNFNNNLITLVNNNNIINRNKELGIKIIMRLNISVSLAIRKLTSRIVNQYLEILIMEKTSFLSLFAQITSQKLIVLNNHAI